MDLEKVNKSKFVSNQLPCIEYGTFFSQTAPILCAGITMYSPLKNWGAVNEKKIVGIIGIGGLGTMGIKLAKALGNEVMAVSSSPNKV